jgi:hypothetical protein
VSAIACSPARSFALIFCLSLTLRLAFLYVVPLDPVRTLQWENAATANELLATGGYSNPYVLPTGPTAHPIPIYTGILAVIYWLFGATMTTEYVRCGLTAAALSAMYAMLPWLASRLSIPTQAGFIGGLAAAVIPFHMPGTLGEEIAAIVLALLMAGSLKRWQGSPSRSSSLKLGVAWGIAFHLSPPLLPVLLGFCAFELYQAGWRRAFRPVLCLLAGVILACAPWTYRNYRAFHEFVFIRSNFGLELRMGNHPGALASMDLMYRNAPALHPRMQAAEAAKVRDQGEIAYMRNARREAILWIRHNPSAFLQLTASRFAHFWLGPFHEPLTLAGTALLSLLALLGLRSSWRTLAMPERAALLLPLLLFPLIYYLLAYMPRYRIPIDGILFLLAGAQLRRLFVPASSPS